MDSSLSGLVSMKEASVGNVGEMDDLDLPSVGVGLEVANSAY